jgi:ABC-type polysaccharide/polyol phosphate transport system ATPase subunit
MSDLAIKVKNVNKVFRIYDRPNDRLKEVFSFKREKFHTDFTALKNVSFEVKKGEFLGIVGRNGAGKSTLLKILSRELSPTSGDVMINGTLSLLQLGVGFDPELTGITNARFASKLLGYSDDDIEGMMEDVIAFADIGEFIHHPVKTYSSGMYSRLSFAVAVNINPDILIADEVLAVGDMSFTQKCLRKMREFKESGKTVVLVSHDVQTVNIFCDTAIWLKDGELFMHGDANQVTTGFQNFMLYDKMPNEYHSIATAEGTEKETKALSPDEQQEKKTSIDLAKIEWTDLGGLPCVGDGRAEIKRMAFLLADTLKNVRSAQGNEEVILLLDVSILSDMKCPQIGFVIYNQQGLAAAHTNNDICDAHLVSLTKGQNNCMVFRFRLPSLANGHYIFNFGMQTGLNMAHKIDYAYEFNVARTDAEATQCGYSIIEDEHFEIIEMGNEQASKL